MFAIPSTSPSCVGGSKRSGPPHPAAERRDVLVAGFAIRSYDRYDIRRRFVQASQIYDLMIGTVKRRSNEGVHPGADTYVMHVALPFRLRYAREQDTGLCHEKPARLEPELRLPACRLDVADGFFERRNVERPLTRLLGNTEAAAEIDVAHIAKSSQKAGELLAGLTPIVGV